MLEQETRKRFGVGKPRKVRELKPGSRHVPIDVQRAVWERDDSRCAFADSRGRRCAERRFLTMEHRTPFALGGPPTLENLCLLCSAHNLESARQVFGGAHIAAKILARTRRSDERTLEPALAADQPLETPAKVLSSLCSLGFSRRQASAAIGRALAVEPTLAIEPLLRQCLSLLVPKAS